MSTPHSFPPPIDDPQRTAERTASFDDPLDDTIDQSFPASDPPSTNPAPSYSAELGDDGEPGFGAGWFGDRRMHLRHEGLLWAAAGALGAAASLRLIGSRRSSHLLWQLAPAALLAGAAITFAREYMSRDERAGC